LHANIELEVEFAKLVTNGVEKQAKLAKILFLSSAKLRGQIKKDNRFFMSQSGLKEIRQVWASLLFLSF